MSNKIVPSIYRAVIDEVVSSIRPEFDEYGVSEDVLAELQHKWENKVMASHVAEFESHPPTQIQHHPPPHAYPPHPVHMIQHPHFSHNPYAISQPVQNGVKAEPIDNRYMLSMPYPLPPLPGPALGAVRPITGPTPSHPGGQTSVISFARQIPVPQPVSRPYVPTPVAQSQSQSQSPVSAPSQPSIALVSQTSQRVPQVDGPSDYSDDEHSPPLSQSFAPRTSHPSLPQPATSASASVPPPSQDLEAINSDLDDSDTEGEEVTEDGVAGETDIVFCTYDKVARVKNKWKCILKDGMIHINGKDYLFAKCTGEFEW